MKETKYIIKQLDDFVDPSTTLILPNGYGPLHYVHTLIDEVSALKGKAIVPILPGQGGTSGELSISSAKEYFINDIIPIISKEKNVVSVICHCSALLYLSEVKSKLFWDKIDRVVVYSFLAHPEEHNERFIDKSLSFGVNIALEKRDKLKSYSDFKVYEEIPVPLHVVHPKTLMNRLRASDSDLKKLKKLKNVACIIQPENGYEIEDSPQIKEVKNIVENVFSSLI